MVLLSCKLYLTKFNLKYVAVLIAMIYKNFASRIKKIKFRWSQFMAISGFKCENSGKLLYFNWLEARWHDQAIFAFRTIRDRSRIN